MKITIEGDGFELATALRLLFLGDRPEPTPKLFLPAERIPMKDAEPDRETKPSQVTPQEAMEVAKLVTEAEKLATEAAKFDTKTLMETLEKGIESRLKELEEIGIAQSKPADTQPTVEFTQDDIDRLLAGTHPTTVTYLERVQREGET